VKVERHQSSAQSINSPFILLPAISVHIGNLKLKNNSTNITSAQIYLFEFL